MAGESLQCVSIVQGEVLMLLSATRKGSRWPNHSRTEESQDPLLASLYQLQEQLNHAHQLSDMDVCAVIRPFCQIVQCEDTTGPVTGMAISSLEKFLAYNLIDPAHPSAPSAVEALSEAVTHARFVGTNPASDEVVLMKILQVLRTLLLSAVGRLLTNESVCEIMQSCFRICFEMRLSEFLHCYGESTLVDLVQLLFSQLPLFSEDDSDSEDTSPIDQTLMTPQQETPPPSELQSMASSESVEGTTTATTTSDQSDVPPVNLRDQGFDILGHPSESNVASVETDSEEKEEEKGKILTPYGLPCVRELLRFLVSLINTDSQPNNSDALVAIGLNLVTVVIECGSSHLCRFPVLASLVQDSLCKHVIQRISWLLCLLLAMAKVGKRPSTKKGKLVDKKETAADDVHDALKEWVDKSTKLEIFVVGKLGSGKSTLINSLLNKEVTEVGPSLAAVTKRIDSYEAILKTELTVSDIEVTLWDSPGLQEPEVNKEEVLQDIATRCGKNVDLVVFCVQMTQPRFDAAEVECINDLTKTLGVEFWDKTLFALTFANDLKVPRNNKEQDLEDYFHARREEWTRLLHSYVQKAGTGPDEASRVPIVPTGYAKEPLPFLKSSNHWLTEFWTMCCKKVSLQSFPALFMVNRDIVYNEEENEKYTEVLQDRLKGLGSSLDQAIIQWFARVGMDVDDRHLWLQLKGYMKLKMKGY